MIRILGILFFLTFIGCDLPKGDKESKSSKKDGIVKQYRADGSLKTEISFKRGLKNGPAKSYYKNRKLRQVIDYVNNVKHGSAKTYYESGKVYQETPYVNGKIEGVRKKYRGNGLLMSEAPYHNNQPCGGLVEYLTNGKKKKKYPKILIKQIDNSLTKEQVILRVSMSDGSKGVDFFIGTLTPEGCLPDDALNVEAKRPGVVDLNFKLPKGTFIMQEVKIIAKKKTKLDNYYLTGTTYNLAVENR